MARIAAALNNAGEPYMIIGGQAVNQHGRVRATYDIDFTMAVSPLDWRRVWTILKKLGLKPLVEDPHEWIIKTHVLPLQAKQSSLRVDISFTDSPYETQAIARGIDIDIEGVPVRFACAEDLVIHKILAWRDVDRSDVKAILLKNPDIDLDDVRHWLGAFAEVLELPLEERLEEAKRMAGM